MTQKQMMKIFFPGYFPVIGKCLGIFCLFFCFTAFYTQTLMDKEGSLHVNTGTLLHRERDSSSTWCDDKNAVVFIDDKAKVYGIIYISDSHSIVQQKSDTMNTKLSLNKNSAKKLSAGRLEFHSPIHPAEKKASSAEYVLPPNSSEYFTASNHGNHTAVFPFSNINIKTAVTVLLNFNILKDFSLEKSLEKEYAIVFIYSLLIDNQKVRPPPFLIM